MAENLLDIHEAKAFVEQLTHTLQPVTMPLQYAFGKILASNVFSPVHVPAFAQSGMDGYAFAFESLGKPLKIAGEQAAGDEHSSYLQPGTAVRIFTGAVVPDGADTVVMQEKTLVADGYLQVNDEALQRGSNVRVPGSEIAKGDMALAAGVRLTPAAIGFLAGMGVNEVEIIPSPRVSIIVTGNELQDPGTTPQFGKVYESNSFALLAALAQLHITDTRVYKCEDDIDALTSVLNQSVAQSDVVLMTGGVSVGDYDFTVKVSKDCGIEKVFHKLKQRPGKPLFFGIKDRVLFFGLPGNPASVLTCFYEYVLVALEKLTLQPMQLKKLKVPLSTAYKKSAGLTHFLKGMFDGEQVHLPDGQESYKLHSYATANCLVVIPDPATTIEAGDEVEIHLIP